jgi:hypothetical protein
MNNPAGRNRGRQKFVRRHAPADGVYVSDDQRLLVFATTNLPEPPRRAQRGNGIGRVVREIYKDGRWPHYFIRYNQGWSEKNTDFRIIPGQGQRFCENLQPGAPTRCTMQQWNEKPTATTLVPLKMTTKPSVTIICPPIRWLACGNMP